MPSKESLERAQKFLDESFRFVATNYVVAPLADLLDEAIREEAEQWHNMPSDHDCKQYPENWGCRRLAQLREGKT